MDPARHSKNIYANNCVLQILDEFLITCNFMHSNLKSIMMQKCAQVAHDDYYTSVIFLL